MSLVIEALRRIEKTDPRAGSIGAFVSSYRATTTPRRSAIPLLLGLLTGGALVFLLGPRPPAPPRAQAREAAPGPVLHRKGAAGLPPPMIIEPVAPPAQARSSADAASPPAGPGRTEGASGVASTQAPLVLQAISERDSHPIAMINDQIVEVGGKMGSARVLRIGADSVEVVFEDGRHETVRFAPLPQPSPEVSPSPTPLP